MSKKIRQIRIEGDVAYVTLTKGYEAVIDAADVPLVGGYNWTARVEHRSDASIRAIYAVRTKCVGGQQMSVRMHRVIAGTPEGFETDHRDGDGLNNRRKNLRVATVAQNQHNQRTRSNNTSGHKGVYFHKAAGKWNALIKVAGKRCQLGCFDTKSDAADAYAKASAALHGEFGRTT